MRVSVSNDGVKRVDIQITHRLSGEAFANALCFQYRGHILLEDGALPALTRKAILLKVREVLASRPADIDWWRDGDDEDAEENSDELYRWADALVRKRFPEMY